MDGAIHSGESSGSDQVEDFVAVVEEPAFFLLEQAFDLIVRQILAADEVLHQVLDADTSAGERGLDLEQLLLGKQAQIDRALSDLLGTHVSHADSSR